MINLNVTWSMYAATTSKLRTTMTLLGVTQHTALVMRMLPRMPTSATMKLRIHILSSHSWNSGPSSIPNMPTRLTTSPPTPNQNTSTE